jgi:trehalose-6-phosphatase
MEIYLLSKQEGGQRDEEISEQFPAGDDITDPDGFEGGP